MKIFQTFQSLVRLIFPQSNWSNASQTTNTDHIAPNSAKSYPYNFITFLPLIYIAFCFMLCFNFLVLEAKAFQEYSDCLYGELVASLAIFNGITLFFNREKCFKFIGFIEKSIDARKFMKIIIKFEYCVRFLFK